MRETFEISDRFIEAGDANGLLYEPLDEPMTFRRTRRYEVEFEGCETSAPVEAFVRRTLFDPISQSLYVGEQPALWDYDFAIEYGMKPSALDLEKEAVLDYYRGLQSPGFEMRELRIWQRLYLFGSGGAPERFVRDLCNPAIQQWNILPGHV